MKGWPSFAFWIAPLTLVILVFVALYTYLTGTKVERATVATAYNSAIFNQDFDKRWKEMGSAPVACSSAGSQRIADLRNQLAALQREVVQERQVVSQKTSELDRLLEKMEGKNEHQ